MGQEREANIMEVGEEMLYENKKGIAIILAAFILLAFASSVINPLHEATDELRHYRFVQHIVQFGSLPVQGELPCRAQGHHPPLFYALGAAATFWIDTGQDICFGPEQNPFWQYRYWEVGTDNKNQYLPRAEIGFPWSGEALAAHLIRGINVLLGAGVVYLTWMIGRTIWPRRRAIALGGAAFVAFNPMFVYMSGSINNDVIAALAGTAVTLACVRLVQDERGLSRRWAVIFGVLFSLALLSKFNLAAIGALIGLSATWVAWRKKQWRLWLETAVIIGVVTALLAGWWFVRNQILYGEPTGVERLTELWGVRNPADSFSTALFELPYTWTSLWGRFGFGQIPLHEVIYIGLRWVIGVSLLGLLIPIIRRDQDELKAVAIPVIILVSNVLLFFAVVFNYLLISPAGAMGRFFFPALPALAILVFYGLSLWFDLFIRFIRKHPASNQQMMGLASVVNVAMVVLVLVALFGYLQPAYARPPTFDDQTKIPNETNAQFDGFVVLRGYDVSDTAVSPEGMLTLDLYWEVIGQPPGNYIFFVHLIDDIGTIVAQRDTHPGLGNFPSSQWQPGDRFVETIHLHVPETVYVPETAELSIGFYADDPDGYRLGVSAEDGTVLGDHFVLADNIELIANSADHNLPNALHKSFENGLTLVGYEFNTRQLQSDDVFAATFYWQGTENAPDSAIVEVGLCEDPCPDWLAPHPVTAVPLSLSNTGEIVEVTANFALNDDLANKSYVIHVTLIDDSTKEYQNIVAEDGHYIDDRLLLAKINIQP